MNWGKTYRPERKADWNDIAQIIHDSVSVEDVLRAYCSHLPIKHNRCPCPIHRGKDLNFSFTRTGYKCFVCGASGDVVALVKDIRECATRADAMRVINRDFNLNLPIDSPADISPELRARVNRAREEAERKEAAHKAWQEKYESLWDAWIECDKTKREADPMSEEYADAAKRIDYLAYLIDCLPEEPR